MIAMQRRNAWALAGVLLLAACFLGLASEVIEAETMDWDALALRQAHAWRAAHPALEPLLRDITALGSTVLMALFTVIVVGYLAAQRQFTRALCVGAAMASGSVAVTALKAFIGRARPDPSLAAFVQDGLSFPSGHASMSAMFFLTVGTLLAQQHCTWRVRAYVIGVAALLTVLVGASRVLLGVHWATDVAAGWLFGAGWAVHHLRP